MRSREFLEENSSLNEGNLEELRLTFGSGGTEVLGEIFSTGLGLDEELSLTPTADLPTTNPPTADLPTPIAGSSMPTAEGRMLTAEGCMPTAEGRMPTAGGRTPTAKGRMPFADSFDQ